MIQFRWGEQQISVLEAGSLRLDGGAMFGVVPRAIWERERKPDERNRIHLSMNLLLIEDGKQRILVDSGAGIKWDEKRKAIYGLDPKTAREILEPAGLLPEQIDLVINTHLHFDHAGGNTILDERGELTAAFPNARYVVQQGELEMARWENERIQASYLEENFEPLAQENGRMWLVDGETAINESVRVKPAPGHTPHMQLVLVETGEGTVAFMGDLVPTTSHISYPYIMGYDLEPLKTLATKKQILPLAAAERWRLVFEHDAALPLGMLEEDRGRLKARELRLEG